jgi:predicted amidophosphoribosyltransferase
VLIRLRALAPRLLQAPSALLCPPLCWGCGGIARRAEPLCLACRRGLRHLGAEQAGLAGVRIWSAVAYEGAARELVRGLKFRGAMALADPMAALIVANVPEEVLPRAVTSAGDDPAAAFRIVGGDHPGRGLVSAAASATVGPRGPRLMTVAPPAPVGQRRPPPALVPVPLHPARHRRRGFNQAAILAEAVAARVGLDVADCLARAGASGSQVGRPRDARLSAPPGHIRARSPTPRRAVIVDDVATTGATLAACAQALRAGGALEVRAVTFARTLGR